MKSCLSDLINYSAVGSLKGQCALLVTPWYVFTVMSWSESEAHTACPLWDFNVLGSHA